MRNVIFRADGAKKVGMGHLNRCLLIANYLKKHHNISSIFLTEDDAASRIFLSNKTYGIDLFYLNSNYTLEDELKTIATFKKDRCATLLIVDLLKVELENEYLNDLHDLGIKICVLSDDSNYHEFLSDMVINGNPNQIGSNYPDVGTTYLIGPQFFIMDARYSGVVVKKKNINSVLVSLGGSDHNDIVFSILDSLLKVSSIQEIIVISSKSTGYIDELKQFIANNSKKITLYLDVESLVNYWKDCSLAITAGGNTLFERIASGTPGATICQLPRQMEIADAFEKLEVNVNLGYGPDLTTSALNSAVSNFFQNSQNHARQKELSSKIINGEGLKYCAIKMLELI